MTTREQLSTLGQARERTGCNVPEARNLHLVPASWHLFLNLAITPKRCHIQRLVACHPVMNMSAGELHAVDGNIALPTLLAAKLWACMLACRAEAGTGLQAVEGIVEALGVARRRAFMPARLETFVAEEGAAALGAPGNKVCRLGAKDWRVRVAWAAERDGRAHGFALAELTDDVRPHWHVLICLCVADEIHAVLRPAEQHVDAVLGAEEANFAVVVAADERDDDDFGFFALEVVDGCQADCLQQLRFHNSLPRRPNRSRLLLPFRPLLEALLRQGLQVTIAQEHFKILAQGGSEFLQLAGVWSQQCDVRALVFALPDQVADQGGSHGHLPEVAVRLHSSAVVFGVLGVVVVEPEQVVPHTDDGGEILDTVVILECGIHTPDELGDLGPHASLDVEQGDWQG